MARWEHFEHGADIGVRGVGATPAEAFEQAALAVIAVVTSPDGVRAQSLVTIHCEGPELEVLLVDWLNALIFEMAARHMVFARFEVRLDGPRLDARAWGEPVDVARWAVAHGWGTARDLERTEEGGQMAGAKPALVLDQAKHRQRDELGTLGSGNHSLEVQRVAEVLDADAARALGVTAGDAVVSIHCGARGLGHQVGTDFLRAMVLAAPGFGLSLPDRELACALLQSELGREYLGAMRAAINCALANRQRLTYLTREVFAEVPPAAQLELLYDVSDNTCKEEEHVVDGVRRRLFVHRTGATRAFGPGHPALPESLRAVGQPVLIGGSMGTSSYVLFGTAAGEAKSFSSACHGAGRAMSRHAALARARPRGRAGRKGHRAARYVAAQAVGLATKVAHLEPLFCVKG